MRRRVLLKSVAALALAPLTSAAFAGGVLPTRRARPTDAAWPDAAAWDDLKRKVGGRLVKPAPLFAPCAPDPKSPACKALFKDFGNPFFLGDQPGATQVSGWQDAWTPALSAWAVAARDSADVVAAVKFARAHNLRLVVKGGGHSYQGTSNAPDSLLIWTRAMNAVTLHDHFVARDCEGVHAPAPAVTVGAGAMWIDAYDAVTTRAGRYVQGGGCTTVGVAGHIQGGGFGSMSKQFGTAAGSLLEAEVVTADGELRTVNPRRDPDLFWAIKGGGGGSLGVVTKVTLRTHDLPANFGGVGFRVQAKSDEAFRRLIGRFVAFYADQLFNPHWGESVTFRSSIRLDVSMVNQGLTDDEVTAIWGPFLDWIAAAPEDFVLSRAPDMGVGPARAWWDADARRRRGSTSMKFDERPGAPAYHAWWSGDGDQVSAFLYGYDSIWLPERLLAAPERERLGDALFAASRPMSVALHFNKGLAGAPPEAIAATRDTAMNPDVLSAFALAIVATGGLPAYPGLPAPNPAYGRREAAKVAASAAILRRLAPDAGSYVSESDYFNADWGRAFWGENHPRLKAAKAKYDPHGLFIVHHGVGAEDWTADGFTRLT